MKYFWIACLVSTLFLLSACNSQQSITVEIAGEDIFFDVIDIEATAGQPITILFENKGTLEHNLVFPAFEVQTDILQAGENTSFTFTASEPGEYIYICSVPGHETLMHGKLIVSE